MNSRTLLRSVLFALLYLAAAMVGRLTLLDETGRLGLVWPAAGVALVWFAARRGTRALVLNCVLLVAANLAVNLFTGISLVAAAHFALAHLVQALAFHLAFGWLWPRLRETGECAPLASLGDLWRLLVTALFGVFCGAVTKLAAATFFDLDHSVLTSVFWLARNFVSIVVIAPLGLRLESLVRARSRAQARAGDAADSWRSTARARLRRSTGWQRAEYVVVVVTTLVVYYLGFVAEHDLPLAFPLLTVTVWAALRLDTTFVTGHTLVVSAGTVALTLYGYGAFGALESPMVRSLLAQTFVGMVAVVGLILALGRDERRALLRQVAAAERAASRQAKLLSTIVDSMNDGLALIDDTGHFLLRNPAAIRLLGGAESGGGSKVSTTAYGLFHPDGTPLTNDELTSVRVLRGEEVPGTDILVRNPGIPEGRIIHVNATVLPTEPDEARSAIVVFHDVTAERRQRDELAAFAGVVAHDLLNPLTTVQGWTEALNDTMRDFPPDPAVDHVNEGLTRIGRAGSRMRHLINDLLAYTTARDATIAPVPVGLADTVTDIAVGRADLASAAGTPRPQFELGTLHDVQADPVLLRQLLDNLISNAIKYTAPGTTPRITVTSTLAEDGQVRVTIADNGIGIPPGQHDAIFGNFHRAHRSQEYTGTGLGLSICKRIVERHGGTIAAHDNPTGGSRFTFTLPAAQPDEPGGGGAGTAPAERPAPTLQESPPTSADRASAGRSSAGRRSP